MNGWAAVGDHPWRTAMVAVLGPALAVAVTVGAARGLAVGFLGVGAVAAGFGLVGAGGQWRAIRRARSTEGRVLRSEPVELELLSRSWRSDFEPAVEYRYRVDGQEYEGEVVWPGPIRPHGATGQRRSVERFLDDYPDGETVTVYYDPVDPSRSFLDPHQGTGGYLAVAGFALLVLAVGTLLGLRAGLLPS